MIKHIYTFGSEDGADTEVSDKINNHSGREN